MKHTKWIWRQALLHWKVISGKQLSLIDFYRRKMDELGIDFKKSLGQNFLINERSIAKIVETAKEQSPSALIEVGPGLGALTEKLLELKLPITLIELDRKLVAYWKAKEQNIIEADALQLDWSDLTKDPDAILVSNLPYQISSSLVIERSLDKDPLKSMILMFQKEVAQRMKAKERTSEYGMLTVIAQAFWKIDMLFEISSKDFWPPPKVASRVLVFKRKPSDIQDKAKFLKFVKAAFAQRRKLMVNNLAHGMQVESESILKYLESLNINPKARAEELTVVQFIQLFKKFGYG